MPKGFETSNTTGQRGTTPISMPPRTPVNGVNNGEGGTKTLAAPFSPLNRFFLALYKACVFTTIVCHHNLAKATYKA